MRVFSSADELRAAVGTEIGVSDWVTITQEQVNTFADATNDHQWIHVDVERAARESPYGGTIAHGYLTLSLLPGLGWTIYTIANTKLGINYGSNKVRFPSPVPVGSEVRLRCVLNSVDEVGGGALQLAVGQTIEIKGHDKPAVAAETLSRIMF